jgi:hypothetical protein
MKVYVGVDIQIHIFFTSALVEGGQLHVAAALPPDEKPAVLIGYEARWAPEPVWTTWRSKNSCPHQDSNSDPSVVQPVASRCTDCAIPVNCSIILLNTELSYPCNRP